MHSGATVIACMLVTDVGLIWTAALLSTTRKPIVCIEMNIILLTSIVCLHTELRQDTIIEERKRERDPEIGLLVVCERVKRTVILLIVHTLAYHHHCQQQQQQQRHHAITARLCIHLYQRESKMTKIFLLQWQLQWLQYYIKQSVIYSDVFVISCHSKLVWFILRPYQHDNDYIDFGQRFKSTPTSQVQQRPVFPGGHSSKYYPRSIVENIWWANAPSKHPVHV